MQSIKYQQGEQENSWIKVKLKHSYIYTLAVSLERPYNDSNKRKKSETRNNHIDIFIFPKQLLRNSLRKRKTR